MQNEYDALFESMLDDIAADNNKSAAKTLAE